MFIVEEPRGVAAKVHNNIEKKCGKSQVVVESVEIRCGKYRFHTQIVQIPQQLETFHTFFRYYYVPSRTFLSRAQISARNSSTININK